MRFILSTLILLRGGSTARANHPADHQRAGAVGRMESIGGGRDFPSPGNNVFSCNGQIDDVRFYNTQPTLAGLGAIYSNGTNGGHP